MKNRQYSFLSLCLSMAFLGAFLGACGNENTAAVEENIVEATPTPAPALTDPSGIQSGVVISPDDPTVNRYFLTAPGTAPTAFDALIATGVAVESADFGFGIAICGIGGVGQPASDCFGDPDHFWALFTGGDGGDWTEALVGADQVLLNDGDRVAFLWTGFDPNTYASLRAPSPLTLEQIAAP